MYSANKKEHEHLWPLPNLWLGVTVCNQSEADTKIPALLATPAAKRFVSLEPLLGAISLSYLQVGQNDDIDALRGIFHQADHWNPDHDDVAEDLALAKGGIPFLNVCLGPKWIGSGKTPRADLVVCSASYKGFVLSAFEVKISRSDFLRDLRSEKWRTYLPHCNRLYFAVLDEVCRKEDIPEEAGLLIRNRKGWYTAKKAPSLQSTVPYDTLKSLIFARQRRSAREKRIDDIMSSRYLSKVALSRWKRSGAFSTSWGPPSIRDVRAFFRTEISPSFARRRVTSGGSIFS